MTLNTKPNSSGTRKVPAMRSLALPMTKRRGRLRRPPHPHIDPHPRAVRVAFLCGPAVTAATAAGLWWLGFLAFRNCAGRASPSTSHAPWVAIKPHRSPIEQKSWRLRAIELFSRISETAICKISRARWSDSGPSLPSEAVILYFDLDLSDHGYRNRRSDRSVEIHIFNSAQCRHETVTDFLVCTALRGILSPPTASREHGNSIAL